MSIGELLRWQWEGYPRYHQSRINLLIHIVAVPLFLLGTIGLIAGVVQLSFAILAIAVGCIVVAVALQGRGHRLEPIPPEPFSGPLNFVSRLFFEQWVTFLRFVLSGVGVLLYARSGSPDLANADHGGRAFDRAGWSVIS